jgi:hypothetical protein
MIERINKITVVLLWAALAIMALAVLIDAASAQASFRHGTARQSCPVSWICNHHPQPQAHPAAVPFAQSGGVGNCTVIAYTPYNSGIYPGPDYSWGGRMYCSTNTYVGDMSACPEVLGGDGVTWYAASGCSHTGAFWSGTWVTHEVLFYSRGTSGHTYRTHLGVYLYGAWRDFWSTRFTL